MSQNGMAMKPTVWTRDYEITSFLLDFDNKLALQPLLGFLQDIAWHHSNTLGFGYQESIARGAIWVLIRQRVEVDQWPGWGDTLTICTWLRPPPGPVVVTRDFELLVGERVVGRAAVHWITIHEQHRRPIPLVFPDIPELFREDGHLPWEPAAVRPFEEKELERLAEFTVRNSDLDMNFHANNTTFGRWILNALPLSELQAHVLRGYEINFLAEARPGERVVLWRRGAHFQGQRMSDGKVVFTVELKADRRA